MRFWKQLAADNGFIIHLTAYALVNGLLAAIALAGAKFWFLWPLLGWGVGILFHAWCIIRNPRRSRTAT